MCGVVYQVQEERAIAVQYTANINIFKFQFYGHCSKKRDETIQVHASNPTPPTSVATSASATTPTPSSNISSATTNQRRLAFKNSGQAYWFVNYINVYHCMMNVIEM